MTRNLILFFSVIMMSSHFTLFAETQAKVPSKIQKFIKKLESKKDTLQGGAVAILYKDKVIYKATFGKQKGKFGRPITSKTLFPLASLSKSVSAVAIGLMVDKKAIDFEETFKLPYLQKAVNLRDIMSHSTGYEFTGNRQIEKGFSRQKLLKTLGDQNPVCDPGECYFYSNMIYGLVEEALNRKKLTLQSAIKQLQDVLKTKAIQVVPIDPQVEVAHPHLKEKNTIKPLPLPPYFPKAAPASAGVFASLDGMIEFFKLSFGYKPHLISQETLETLFTPVVSNRDVYKWNLNWPCSREKIESYYGIGWRILKMSEYPGKDLIFHAGFLSGVTPFMGFIPSEEIGIIFLVNQQSRLPFEMGIDFWSAFLS
ncbi:serine hydrolase domain-containing protein [Candidatus Nucleicultrix amoebiphila]|uniref:serine hydrolase domain-containing protein n=1 Tax=Candidatus Nucleicultrix amoebiphila TaxID=1509244 RepID=UPI000A26D584|nr:serine hydrolase domain-containing protein [Candidatus Nucleicultrix amoebiphila]